jgi:sulfatase modifying factor 1
MHLHIPAVLAAGLAMAVACDRSTRQPSTPSAAGDSSIEADGAAPPDDAAGDSPTRVDGAASASAGGAEGGVRDSDANDGGAPAQLPEGGSAGRSCGDNGECGASSCCESGLVPGGTFPMGHDCDVQCIVTQMPEHPATVSDFRLDTFEVTVGRFRSFVEAYSGVPPGDGAGENRAIAGSGWQSSWNSQLASNREELEVMLASPYGQSSTAMCSWTEQAGANELLPVNCIDWYHAFAFCIWDGGRLPTEAEWEYAAAGGSQDRAYPWGDDEPTAEHASVDCQRDGNADCSLADLPPVGSTLAGKGRWGHLDLVGGVSEWVLDWHDSNWYSTDGSPCDNCARLTPAPNDDNRVVRGGSFIDSFIRRVSERGAQLPSRRTVSIGIRCARDAP